MEEELYNVRFSICRQCLDGEGKQCPTPGCAFIWHRPPMAYGDNAVITHGPEREFQGADTKTLWDLLIPYMGEVHPLKPPKLPKKELPEVVWEDSYTRNYTNHHGLGGQDPIFFSVEEQAWYFSDETWSGCHGPFSTQKEAAEACLKYAETL